MDEWISAPRRWREKEGEDEQGARVNWIWRQRPSYMAVTEKTNTKRLGGQRLEVVLAQVVGRVRKRPM